MNKKITKSEALKLLRDNGFQFPRQGHEGQKLQVPIPIPTERIDPNQAEVPCNIVFPVAVFKLVRCKRRLVWLFKRIDQ